jgi:hypothetical protein
MKYEAESMKYEAESMKYEVAPGIPQKSPLATLR